MGGELPFGLSLLQSNSTSVNIVGIPTQAGTYIAVLRAMDQHGDLQDKIFYLIIDPAGMQQNKITLFNGSEIPWSPARPGYLAGGRYDPMRFGTSQEFSRMNLAFFTAPADSNITTVFPSIVFLRWGKISNKRVLPRNEVLPRGCALGPLK